VQEDPITQGATVVPNDVLDVAMEAAHAAGAELTARHRRPAEGLGAKLGPADLVSDADRAAEAAIAAVLERRRPGDAILAEEGTATRAGTGGCSTIAGRRPGAVPRNGPAADT